MFIIEDGRDSFYQWDLNRRLIVRDNSITEVHFCNRTDDCSLVVEVYEENGSHYADVPNILLQTDWRINVYAFDSEYTKHSMLFHVNARTKPADYVYTETEVKTWDTLAGQIQGAIDEFSEAEEERAAAEAIRVENEVKRQTAFVEMEQTAKEAKEATGLLTQASQLYANALKGNKTGEAIAITDASPLEHEIEVKVRGKNLIPFPYENPAGTSVTKSGVTFTTNADGSITLNGTATGNIFYSLVTPYLELRDGIYTLSGGYRNDPNRAAVCIRNPGNTIMASSEGKSAKCDTQTAGNIIKEAYLYIYNGSTFDNITIYPQLEEGTIATTYAPYVEDISTVKVKRHGKNLFKATTEQKVLKGITAEKQADGTYHVYGTSDGTGDFWMDMQVVLPKGIYTGSGSPAGASSTTHFIEYHNRTTGKGKVDYGTGATFETAETNTIVVHMVVKSGQTVDLIFKPMIEAGTGDKVYAPYKEPIEYQVSADGTVEGVNPIYPTTTLMTDTAGAVMDCTYNRDTNAAFAELTQALASMGANI